MFICDVFFLFHEKINNYSRKIGLYISSHMKSIREKICINDESIFKNLFTRRFYKVWNKLFNRAILLLDIFKYLQFFIFISYHVFIIKNVNVAVYETYLDEEFDATNIVRKFIITTITLIEMNYVKLFNSTIKNIVWQKTEIFKSENLVFSTFQLLEIITVLQKKAREKQIMLKFFDIDSTFSEFAISLKSKIQLQNCSFVFAYVRVWFRVKTFETQNIITLDDFTRDFENFFLSERF